MSRYGRGIRQQNCHWPREVIYTNETSIRVLYTLMSNIFALLCDASGMYNILLIIFKSRLE